MTSTAGSEPPRAYLQRVARQRRRRPATTNWVTQTGGGGFASADPLQAFVQRITAEQEQQLRQRFRTPIDIVSPTAPP